MRVNDMTVVNPDDAIRLEYNRLILVGGDNVLVSGEYLPFWQMILAQRQDSPTNNSMIKVSRSRYARADSVDHVYSVRPKVCVVLQDGTSHMSYETIAGVVRTNPALLLRVHRRCAVGVNHVVSVVRRDGYWEIETKQTRGIIVSKTNNHSIQQFLSINKD